jgi:hypothetical protein
MQTYKKKGAMGSLCLNFPLASQLFIKSSVSGASARSCAIAKSLSSFVLSFVFVRYPYSFLDSLNSFKSFVAS